MNIAQLNPIFKNKAFTLLSSPIINKVAIIRDSLTLNCFWETLCTFAMFHTLSFWICQTAGTMHLKSPGNIITDWVLVFVMYFRGNNRIDIFRYIALEISSKPYQQVAVWKTSFLKFNNAHLKLSDQMTSLIL